jgi:hypothetical protein
MRSKRFISVGSIAAMVAASLVLPALAFAQDNSCNINYALYGTPGSYTFTVPAGVTQLRILSIGAGGGGGAGSGGWGSAGGGACGGALAGGNLTVTPGQKIPLYVGYGGRGGNGSTQANPGGCPWCGYFDPSSNGSTGGNSGIDSIVAVGGSWGRTGYHNLYNQFSGGAGGGSGGGGGGNGWPGFYATPGNGGTAGGQTNSQGAGGYCTGGGWNIDPSTYVKNVSVSAGAGGYSPGGWQYWGGGGGGGVVINSSTTKGGDGQDCANNGGKGYGGGGGGSGLSYTGAGGNGAPGAVYIEWDADTSGAAGSCALSCSVTFATNPLTGASTRINWTSQNASLFYINNVGYVSGTGSAQISSPGDYSGQVVGIGNTASCPAVLQGSGGACVSTSQTCQINGSILNSCGQTSQCRYGCSTTTNQCNAASQCQAAPTCDAEGHKVINICDGSTLSDCDAQGLVCISGQCVKPTVTFVSFNPFDQNGVAFTSSGHLSALPALVAAGKSTHLYWNVKNALDCSITGSNGDGIAGSAVGAWNTLTSGLSGVVTSPIMSRTIYTLLCNALTGAVPSFVQESTTVNIVPVFQEQ